MSQLNSKLFEICLKLKFVEIKYIFYAQAWLNEFLKELEFVLKENQILLELFQAQIRTW